MIEVFRIVEKHSGQMLARSFNLEDIKPTALDLISQGNEYYIIQYVVNGVVKDSGELEDFFNV